MTASFRLIDVARSVVDEVNRLIDSSPRRLVYDVQLRASAGSIAANIREAFGRRPGAERAQFFRFARGSAEETDEHLRANYGAGRLKAATYFRLHNRIVTIIKMLNVLISKINAIKAAL